MISQSNEENKGEKRNSIWEGKGILIKMFLFILLNLRLESNSYHLLKSPLSIFAQTQGPMMCLTPYLIEHSLLALCFCEMFWNAWREEVRGRGL